jgi:hypothetical protein
VAAVNGKNEPFLKQLPYTIPPRRMRASPGHPSGRQLTEVPLAADELAELSDETLGKTSFANSDPSVGS